MLFEVYWNFFQHKNEKINEKKEKKLKEKNEGKVKNVEGILDTDILTGSGNKH